MRAVIQRVSKASVTVEGRTIAQIGNGILVLLGVKQDDSKKEAELLAKNGKLTYLQ